MRSQTLRNGATAALIIGALTTFSFCLGNCNDVGPKDDQWSAEIRVLEQTSIGQPGPPFAECNFKLDFVFLLDSSWSYFGRYQHLAARLGEFYGFVMSNFPGSRFGISSFIDPPLCAGESDYCAASRLSLDSAQSRDLDTLATIMRQIPIGNGRDTPENLYGGALRIMHSSVTGWSPPALDVDPVDGRRPLRLLFAITDAIGHVAPNKQICVRQDGPQLAPFPIQPTSHWLSRDVNEDCNEVEYPMINHLPVYVARTRVHPMFYFTHAADTRPHAVPSASLHRMALYFGAGYNVTAESHPELLGDGNSWTLTEDIHRYIFGRFHNFSPLIRTGWDDFLGFGSHAADMVTDIANNVCAELQFSTTPVPSTTTTTTTCTTTTIVPTTPEPAPQRTTELPPTEPPEWATFSAGDPKVTELLVTTSSSFTDTDGIPNHTALSGAAIAAGAAVAGAATMYVAGRFLNFGGRDDEDHHAFLEDAELQDVAVDREVHTEVEDFFC